MPINIRTWLGRLTVQCPGWYFWYSTVPFADRPWHAAPHPQGGRPDGDPMRLPGRVDCDDPKTLRDVCRNDDDWAPVGSRQRAGRGASPTP